MDSFILDINNLAQEPRGGSFPKVSEDQHQKPCILFPKNNTINWSVALQAHRHPAREGMFKTKGVTVTVAVIPMKYKDLDTLHIAARFSYRRFTGKIILNKGTKYLKLNLQNQFDVPVSKDVSF